MRSDASESQDAAGGEERRPAAALDQVALRMAQQRSRSRSRGRLKRPWCEAVLRLRARARRSPAACRGPGGLQRLLATSRRGPAGLRLRAAAHAGPAHLL